MAISRRQRTCRFTAALGCNPDVIAIPIWVSKALQLAHVHPHTVVMPRPPNRDGYAQHEVIVLA